jgi:hypothetical protein
MTDDKRVWRGKQREIARGYLLRRIEELLDFLTDTPADTLRATELKSIRAAIKRRKLAQRQR